MQSFLQEADELGIFLVEKTVIAQEETYDEARSLHGKWQKHQAFEAELSANKERLEKLKEVSQNNRFEVQEGRSKLGFKKCYSYVKFVLETD